MQKVSTRSDLNDVSVAPSYISSRVLFAVSSSENDAGRKCTRKIFKTCVPPKFAVRLKEKLSVVNNAYGRIVRGNPHSRSHCSGCTFVGREPLIPSGENKKGGEQRRFKQRGSMQSLSRPLHPNWRLFLCRPKNPTSGSACPPQAPKSRRHVKSSLPFYLLGDPAVGFL